jgi:hypothetical protein
LNVFEEKPTTTTQRLNTNDMDDMIIEKGNQKNKKDKDKEKEKKKGSKVIENVKVNDNLPRLRQKFHLYECERDEGLFIDNAREIAMMKVSYHLP